jgi:hypothetical protein
LPCPPVATDVVEVLVGADVIANVAVGVDMDRVFDVLFDKAEAVPVAVEVGSARLFVGVEDTRVTVAVGVGECDSDDDGGTDIVDVV